MFALECMNKRLYFHLIKQHSKNLKWMFMYTASHNTDSSKLLVLVSFSSTSVSKFLKVSHNIDSSKLLVLLSFINLN